MSELDDLFRQELSGHASEPGADLWARLQARTAAEAAHAADPHPVDARFRAGLAGHAPPPRRELWERLEDEHLRPRPRRRMVVAWGRLAVAASLLLLVLAGGAGLWWNARPSARPPVATTARPGADSPTAKPSASGAGQAPAPSGAVPLRAPAANPSSAAQAIASSAPAAVATDGAPAAATLAAPAPAQRPRRAPGALVAAQTWEGQKKRKNFSTQATGSGASPSSSPVASTTGRRRAASALPVVPGLPKPTRQPDAAADQLARTGGRNTPGAQLPAQPETPALAAASPQVIEVEVRRGNAPVVGAAATPVAAAPARESRPRLRLGGLLRQAGHALHGEQLSLAEATGLPEAVTVQAHLGDRVLSKTIRL